MARHMAGECEPTASGGPSVGGLLSSVFIVLALEMLSIPLVGMAVRPTTATSENRELTSLPSLTGDSGPNWGFLAQLGAYFEDHFAFKNELIDADARIKAALTATSATNRVVLGSEGWLYYQGTLDDYQRTNGMSARAISNAVRNISLMQEYVESQGCRFVITLAPDKNALYPEHMPYYLPAGEGWTNLDRMRPLMEAAGVNYLDLHEILGSYDEVLYCKTDSHWTNEGARIAADSLMDAVGHEHADLAGTPTSMVDHAGDLSAMLLPASAEPERMLSYDAAQQFDYVGDAADVEASTIQTRSTDGGADGTLICYRDSFGNALLQYLASSYESAHFSKMIPYDLGLVAHFGADDVIVERTERHASTFATNPPYMPAPAREVDLSAVRDAGEAATLSQVLNGPYVQIGGSIAEESLPDSSRVYAVVSSGGARSAFECFCVSAESEQVSDVEAVGGVGADDVVGDFGYRVFLPRTMAEDKSKAITIEIIVDDGTNMTCVASAPLIADEN